MSEIVMMIGFVIIFVGSILFLIEIFSESVLWGVGCLIISPLSLVFALLHWDVSKRPIMIQLVGLVFVFIAVSTGAA